MHDMLVLMMHFVGNKFFIYELLVATFELIIYKDIKNMQI